MINNNLIVDSKDESTTRKGCKDVFHAFMVEGATFDGYYDIPFIPQKEVELPSRLVAYDKLARYTPKDGDFVHFYLDDQKFDGPKGIWKGITERQENKRGFKLSNFNGFSGIIAPDFSLYMDMPRCMQIWNVYRSRAVGYYLTTLGYNVIPNVRWTDEESYSFAFDGIEKGSVVAVGTLGCGKEILDRTLFIRGFIVMVKRVNPSMVIIYGSISKELKKVLENFNISYKQFDTDTHKAFEVYKHGNEE